MKRIKIVLGLFVLFCVSFCIGYGFSEYYQPKTITATMDNYNYSNGDLLLLDQNGHLWAFTEVYEPPKDSDSYLITYRKHWELLSLTCNGQEIPV